MKLSAVCLVPQYTIVYLFKGILSLWTIVPKRSHETFVSILFETKDLSSSHQNKSQRKNWLTNLSVQV